MTSYELATVIIGIIGLLFVLYQIFYNIKNNDKIASINKNAADEQKNYNSAIIELEISNMINSRKSEMMELIYKQEKDKESDILPACFNAAMQNYLNAYEEACAKYRDSKIDKERFKKMHKKNIKDIVEDNLYVRYFQPSITSSYKAILYVYSEFEDLESKVKM